MIKHEVPKDGERLNARAESRLHVRSVVSPPSESGIENVDDLPVPNFATAERDRSRVLDVETAEDFATLRARYVAEGNHRLTYEAIGKAINRHQKLVFQWEDGSKKVPISLLRNPRVPQAFREDLAETVLSAARSVSGDTRAFTNLGRAVGRLKAYAEHAPMTDMQRKDLARAVRRFIAELESVCEALEAP